jgi:hypothetical protein
MIVVSPSVVLHPADALDGNNPLVGWHTLATLGNISATSEDAAFPVANIVNPSTALFWKAASNAVDQYLTAAISEVDPIDYVGIAGHNFGSAQIPVSIEALLDPSGAPSTWTALLGPRMLADDAPTIFRLASQSVGGLRVRLQQGLALPFAAVLYVGRLTVLPRRIYVGHRPQTYNRQTTTLTGMSEEGHFLGRVTVRQTRLAALAMSNITAASFRGTIKPWFDAAVDRPFFWAWRPASYPREVAYSWFTSDPQVSNQRPNGMMDISASMQGIVE